MIDEQNLVEQARRHTHAFGQLYDLYADRIYHYVQRELKGETAVSQDILAATFEKALKQLPRYEWRGVSFGAWLYKIARNEIRMHYRRQKWTLPLLDRFRSSISVERTVQAQETANTVQAAMCQLSERDQELLRLIYYEELSHPEVGEILGCSANNVAVRLHRAHKRLRQLLSPQAQEVLFDVSSR